MANRQSDAGLALPPLSTLLALSLLTLSGCDAGRPETDPMTRDSAGILIVENVAPHWLPGEEWTISSEPVLDLGVMDGDPAFQLFEVVGAVRMRDGRIAVANSGSSEIRFFDSQGRFLGGTGEKGSGPGEFEDLMFLRKTVEDSLLAYDWRNRRVSVLAADGEFLRSFELSVLTTSGGFPVVADPFPDGDLLLATDMFTASDQAVTGTRRDSAVYYLVNARTGTTEELGALPGGESYQTTDGENWLGGGLVFGKSGHAAVSGNGFYYGSSDRFEIEFRTKAGGLSRILRLDVDNLPVTQGDIDRYIEDRMARARPERRQIYQAMFEAMPFPSSMPAYGEFRVDADHNLWVEVVRRPGDDQPAWRVFDSEGRYLGTVETPPRFHIFEVGSDYLLGRWWDDLDVEHVRMYRISKN